MIVVDAAIVFLKVHLVAVRITEMIYPTAIVKTCRVHYKNLAIPLAYRVAIPGQRRRLRRKFAPICPDIPPRPCPLEELDRFVRCLDKLNRPGEEKQTRYAGRIAFPRWIVSEA